MNVKYQKATETSRGSKRGERHEARRSSRSTLMMTTNKTTTIAEAKQQKKNQEQERATFRPAAKTITKAGGATCCCCYCCCHKPQHNSKVYATHNGKLHKSAAQHNCQQQRGRSGKGATSSAAVRGIRSLFAACYNCCYFSSSSFSFPATAAAVATKFNCLTLQWPRLQVGSTCNSYRKMLFPFPKAN